MSCFAPFGIYVFGDERCRNGIREDREDRIELRQDGHSGRVDSRQSERTNRNYNRNQRKLGKGLARQYGTAPGFGAGVVDIVESGNEALAEVFGGQGGQLVGAYATGGASLLTGLFGGTDANGQTVPMSPVVPLAAAAAIAAVIYNNR